jgi:hypothetical protein
MLVLPLPSERNDQVRSQPYDECCGSITFITNPAGRTANSPGRRSVKENAMKRAPKPLSTRRAPVPSDDHADIDDWMRRLVPDLQPIVQTLDDSIRETIPGLRYAVKWKRAYYGVPEHGWVIEMVAYDVSVNMVFFGGAGFDPPPPLGTTDGTRYVKVKTLDEAQGPEMRRWIEQAAHVPGWSW